MTYRGHMQNGVAVLDTPVDIPDGTPVRIDVDHQDSDYWRNRSVAEMLLEQGVPPVHNLDELAGDWPEEDSIDEFLATLRQVRR